MKLSTKNLVLSLFLILAGSPLIAQTQQDSSANRERRQRRVAQQFVDENGDGIDDRLGRAATGNQRRKDRFIDEDGDGICDNRANGLGFRHGASGTGMMKGADGKGKGRRSGSGGKP